MLDILSFIWVLIGIIIGGAILFAVGLGVINIVVTSIVGIFKGDKK